MKSLLFAICFCPFLATAQQINKAGPHDLIFLHCDHGEFDAISRTVAQEWIISGNAALRGAVEIKVGEVDIKCDSAVVTKKEITAYNVHLSVTDPIVPDVKGDQLKYDLVLNKATVNGNITSTRNGEQFHAQSATLDCQLLHYTYQE